MDIQVQRYLDVALGFGLAVGTKILGAILLWIVGRFIIRALLRVLDRSTSLRKVDETLARYLHSVASVLLNILLFASVLSVFGVETTTFAGLLAAAGVAIGVAWSGLLSNLAAGVFMIVLRPFKTGDYVTAGGVTGTVHGIGLFVTSIDTDDNVRTIIGNGKIFAETIQNFSNNAYRRVDIRAQLAHGADHDAAIRLLRQQLAQIPNIVQSPAPQVEIIDFTLAGPVLAVRAFTHTSHYWDTYFAMTKIVRDDLGKLALPVPATHFQVQQRAA